jgi:thiol-disulfide isomerase/thioredoxin
MRYLAVCTFALLLTGRAAADRPRTETPAAAAFKALAAEYDATYQQVRANYKAVKDDSAIDEEARKYRAKVHDLEGEYAPRFLALAEKHPGDPAAVDALVKAAGLGAGESPASEKALALMEKKHVKDVRLAVVMPDLTFSKWPGADAFVRAVLEKSPSREARGQAAYCLAHRQREKAAFELSGPGADKASADAEALFRLVAEKYADLPHPKRGTLGEWAVPALAELQRLAVGRVAPEIEGEDGDVKRFKLSDYRGKVVVLDFWGHWCPDCRAVYPRQRELAKRFEGKPFVLLGVNSDEDKDALKKVLAKRGVTWRYWWDGGSRNGPIATAWDIQWWPTIYVLDQKGVIRHKGHEELAAKLGQLVDELLKEGEGRASAR